MAGLHRDPMRLPTAFVAVAISVALASCKQESPQSQQSESSVVAQATPLVADAPARPALPSPARLAAVDTETRIYVDLSGSMQGYERTSGGALYGLLAACKEELYAEGFFDLKAAGFADSVDALHGVSGLVTVLDWKADRARTCLASPLLTEVKLASRGRGDALSVVITDGVASATEGSCGGNCAAGGDVTCVAESVREYVKAGNGLWIIGLKVPFRGAYYPEQGTIDRIAVTASVSRPIYLWIGTSNVAAGRHVVQSLALRMAAKRHQVLAYEVWPGSWTGKEPWSAGDNWASADFAISNGESGACGDGRVLQFMTVKKDVECPQVSLLSDGNNWRPGDRWPFQINVRPFTSAPDAPVRTLVAMASQWPPVVNGGYVQASFDSVAGTYFGCMVSSDRRISLRQNWTGRMDVSALRAWSTEDDSRLENVGKTLNLESLWGLTAKRLVDDANAGMWTDVLLVDIDPNTNSQ
jgi:hypothetical protein